MDINFKGAFRTPGIPIPAPVLEPEELPKYLFVAECNSTTKKFGNDMFTVLANKYDEVLKFLTVELRYKQSDIREIKLQSTLVEGTNIIAYKR